jgi:DNA (cytosine-5)-methyltransferase 1
MELPAFPPGPADFDAWSRILEQRPDLAPAITKEYEEEIELALRGVADGLAGRLVLGRADILKILGNGVVPDQAAFAFLDLHAKMMR